ASSSVPRRPASTMKSHPAGYPRTRPRACRGLRRSWPAPPSTTSSACSASSAAVTTATSARCSSARCATATASCARRRRPSQAASTSKKKTISGHLIPSRRSMHLPTPSRARARRNMALEQYAKVARRTVPTTVDDGTADVCLIVEGAYPYISGGVSSWVDGLMRRHSTLRFCVVVIWPEPPVPPSKYSAPPNLTALHHLYLSEFRGRRGWRSYRSLDRKTLFGAVDAFLRNGRMAEL